MGEYVQATSHYQNGKVKIKLKRAELTIHRKQCAVRLNAETVKRGILRRVINGSKFIRSNTCLKKIISCIGVPFPSHQI